MGALAIPDSISACCVFRGGGRCRQPVGGGRGGVTQSAVSQTISQIETTLGMRVLDRSRRPYRLTPAGVTLQRQSRQIVDDVDRLIAQVREADLMNRPAIRIGMIDSFAATTGRPSSSG